ncbi:FAGL041Cp [Eremothecium gossypii FDAG1]|nr:FAGL041Cp [Eremothecium gossypii FDAG1]
MSKTKKHHAVRVIENMSELVLNIIIGNIHCKQCEFHLTSILSKFFYLGGTEEAPKNFSESGDRWYGKRIITSLLFFKPPKKITVTQWSINAGLGLVTLRIPINAGSDRNIKSKFEAAYFSMLKRELNRAGFDVCHINVTYNLPNEGVRNEGEIINIADANSKVSSKSKQAHLEYCSSCLEAEKYSSSSGESSIQVMKPKIYRATFLISDQAIDSNNRGSSEDVIRNVLKTSAVDENGMELTPGKLSVLLSNKLYAQSVADALRDNNFQAQLVDMKPVVNELKYKITAIIGGITCASCCNSITAAASKLDFIADVAVNAVTKTAIFISDVNNERAINCLRDVVEECGFEFELVGVPQSTIHSSVQTERRVVTIEIDGMYCQSCPQRVVASLENYNKANIEVTQVPTLKSPHLTFSYVPNQSNGTTIRALVEHVRTSILPANSSYQISVKVVEGSLLDSKLKDLNEREQKSIMRCLIFAAIVAIPTFVFGIIGMSLLPGEHRFRKWLEKPLWVKNVPRVIWILLILSTPVYFSVAEQFHAKACRELHFLWAYQKSWTARLFKFGSMNLLVSLGTSVAYFASILLLILSALKKDANHHKGSPDTYFDSVVFLTLFLLIGRLLESLSKSKMVKTLESLTSLKQRTGILMQADGARDFKKETSVSAEMLELGDHILIKPGASPAVDALIVQGETEFDESSLTGESRPITHFPGDQIFAGTVNVGQCAVIAKVSTAPGNSLLDHVISAVRDGQLRRAPIERIADVLTGYFVPFIVLLAILTWAIWLILGFAGVLSQEKLDGSVGGWPFWSLEFAIAVFVIACPCGIGLAAPTALFVGANIAAKYGILARGGSAAFQMGSKVTTVCFDKTGTLTKGCAPEVTDYAIYPDPRIHKILGKVLHEFGLASKHPLSHSMKCFALKTLGEDLSDINVLEIKEIPGKGMTGVIEPSPAQPSGFRDELVPSEVIVGNEKFMAENGCQLSPDQESLLYSWKIEGRSIIIIGMNFPEGAATQCFIPTLFLAVRDELRPEAKEVVQALHERGIECWMISGDNSLAANAVALEVGIKHVIADVLPEGKAEKIQWIRETSGQGVAIAMVGDGMNDAPAIAAADVGISLASGSDLAMISCDFVLLSKKNPLTGIVVLLQLSKKVFRRVKFNFVWALVYNIICVPIAAGVLYPYKETRLSPVWASIAMAASSVSVVLSSNLLRFYRPSKIVPRSQMLPQHTTRNEARRLQWPSK